MTVNLSKGGNVNLNKVAPGVLAFTIGLGWKARPTAGATFDLDACAFLLNGTDKVRTDADFIYFNNKKSTCGSIEHSGDNLTGVGDGDDETIKINVATLPADVERVKVGVVIYDAAARRQNFGQVSDAYIRVLDATTGTEIARYDLSEDASTDIALLFGEIYKHNGEWKFKALGQGGPGGIAELAKGFGVNA